MRAVDLHIDWVRRLVCLGLAGWVFIGLPSLAAAASEGVFFVTVERAGPKAPASVSSFDDPELLPELESELRGLPPSTRGFPKWLVHVFAGTERQKSYAVFEEDLARNPSIARAVNAGDSVRRFQYHVEMSGSYWEQADALMEKVSGLGRPVFYLGVRSNWPAVEVVLTEKLEDGLPPVGAARSEEEAAARSEFFERVGPLLRNKTANRKLDAAYERLAEQLFQHHSALVASAEVKQFATRFRRYRWRGNGGPRVAVRAEYRSPDRDSADRIGSYFASLDTETKGQTDPKSFGFELVTKTSSASELRGALETLFPGVRIKVTPGRPLVD